MNTSPQTVPYSCICCLLHIFPPFLHINLAFFYTYKHLQVEYCAVEMQSSLLSAATSRLVSSQDFQQETQEQPLSTTKAPIVNLGHFVGHLQSNNKSVEVRLTPLVADLSKSNETELLSQMSSQHTLHFDLVVACSFADLMAPWKFAKMMSILAPGSLLYLPITFAGGTRYDSDHYEECKGLGRRQGSSLEAGRIPDETVIEQIYHQHLVSCYACVFIMYVLRIKVCFFSFLFFILYRSSS